MKKLKLTRALLKAREKLTKTFISVYTALMTILCLSVTVFADKDSGEDVAKDVVSKVNNVRDMILAIAAAGGSIYLVISIIKASKGHKNQDDRMFDQGVSGIIVSIIIMSISTVIGIFT